MKKRYIITVGAAAALCAVGLIILGPAGRAEGGRVDRETMRVDEHTQISYLRAGDPLAPRIIYVHGSPGDAHAWDAYLRDPIAGHESIAIDRIGYGRTLPRDPEASLEAQARALEPFLVQRDGRWPILVGHSYGGPVVCRAAADYPGRVGGIVVVSGAEDPKLERTHWYQHVGDWAFVRMFLPRSLVASNRELAPLREELEKLEPLLKNVTCPVALVHGRQDWLVSAKNVDYLKKHLPEGSIENINLIERHSHFIPWTAEEAIRKAITGLAVSAKAK